MTNKAIAQAFQELGQLMELHGENVYKIRSYQNAYLRLRKLDQSLADMSMAEIRALPGVGDAISSKIVELVHDGQMQTLEKYRAKTPPGVQQMLGISGFGPKKIRTIWQELGVENIGELRYAINENRLLELKGFGAKTQETLRKQLDYYLRHQGQYHYAALHSLADQLVSTLSQLLPGVQVALTGAVRRREVVLEGIALLVAAPADTIPPLPAMTDWHTEQGVLTAQTSDGVTVTVHSCTPAEWGSALLATTGDDDFLAALALHYPDSLQATIASEADCFVRAGLAPVPPELRSGNQAVSSLVAGAALPELIEERDIRGIIHNHTTYSDGVHTLSEMATYCRDLGYEYLVISDHSQAAFYANGLSEERLLTQLEEIDALNAQLAPFRIFKSTECDILNDGSLDYSDELLAQLDLVIASVHSQLRMDEAKATERLLRAIAHPATRILGHPTGRLLLSRPGYPIDHRRIIDACAEYEVVIELNANPYRLDLDWQWIPYARERGVLISINPDAHSQQGIHDIQYGVLAARKGGLTAANCLNTKSKKEFEEWLNQRR